MKRVIILYYSECPAISRPAGVPLYARVRPRPRPIRELNCNRRRCRRHRRRRGSFRSLGRVFHIVCIYIRFLFLSKRRHRRVVVVVVVLLLGRRRRRRQNVYKITYTRVQGVCGRRTLVYILIL